MNINLLALVPTSNQSNKSNSKRLLLVYILHVIQNRPQGIVVVVVVVVVVSHIQRTGCQPEKTTLHGGQSRSWSAEQGKDNKRKSRAAYSPPTPTHHTARSEKINKLQEGERS